MCTVQIVFCRGVCLIKPLQPSDVAVVLLKLVIIHVFTVNYPNSQADKYDVHAASASYDRLSGIEKKTEFIAGPPTHSVVGPN